jgi:hypothetical protein
MNCLFILIIFIAVLLPTSVNALAGVEPLKIVSIKTPPKIDGVIESEEWNGAVKAELNYQVYPGQEDTPASERTEAMIMYDRERLYIAFHAFDSTPSAIRAPVSKLSSSPPRSKTG